MHHRGLLPRDDDDDLVLGHEPTLGDDGGEGVHCLSFFQGEINHTTEFTKIFSKTNCSDALKQLENQT